MANLRMHSKPRLGLVHGKLNPAPHRYSLWVIQRCIYPTLIFVGEGVNHLALCFKEQFGSQNKIPKTSSVHLSVHHPITDPNSYLKRWFLLVRGA